MTHDLYWAILVLQSIVLCGILASWYYSRKIRQGIGSMVEMTDSLWDEFMFNATKMRAVTAVLQRVRTMDMEYSSAVLPLINEVAQLNRWAWNTEIRRLSQAMRILVEWRADEFVANARAIRRFTVPTEGEVHIDDYAG